jgi:hypothetical protein
MSERHFFWLGDIPEREEARRKWGMAPGNVSSGKERSDHVEATIEALERVLVRLRAGTSPEDCGRDVVLIGRMMERRA